MKESGRSWLDADKLDLEFRVDYHGIIKACTIVYFTDDVCWEENAKSLFVELALKFTDGLLVDLKWLKPTENDISSLL